jgi:uncharacterized membrane protein YebE (DUF533 family)
VLRCFLKELSMVDARQLLDALVGATAKRLTGEVSGPPGQAVQQSSGEAQSPLTNILDMLFPAGQGGAADPYVQKAKDFVSRTPGLAQAALLGVAGAFARSQRTGGLAHGAVRLGGLALIGALAYKAYQNHQAGKPLLGGDQGTADAKRSARALPSLAGFDPGAASDDDALLFARAMVAAATADGRVDNNERTRIVQALTQAGIDPVATRWLEDELASPASVEALAEPVQNPDKAAQVYAAARLAIDPDTIQEREFLRQLAESLDLDPDLARRIDEAAAGLRA